MNDKLRRLTSVRGRLGTRVHDSDTGAEGVDDLREAILRAVTHDLRTPLTGIKAAATSLLCRDVEWSDDAMRAFCEIVDEEADRLDRLIGNLLALSRLQSGVLDLQLGAVSLVDAVDDALVAIGSPRERVVVEVPNTLPLVAADAALLSRAVANVIENALQWSLDEQAVLVRAEVDGDVVRVQVVDHGAGIPGDRLDSVFTSFQRFDDGPTVHRQGLGLGLAVARAAVEAGGGSLSPQPTTDVGTTMVFWLPVFCTWESQSPH